jgi:muconolactone delta-isomerase
MVSRLWSRSLPGAQVTLVGREAYLQELREIIRNIDQRPVIPHRPTTDFDPETFIDRATRFIAQWHVTPRWTEEANELVPQEIAAVKELWRAGKVLEHWIAADRKTGWLVVRAESLTQVEATLAGLPLHPYLDYTVSAVERTV